MVSSTSDYALRAILLLARSSADRPLRADEIARGIGAPGNYLAKTMNALAKAGIVTSARGPFGGFSLAIPANELSVARIIECFDEPRTQVTCLLGTVPCDPHRPCTAHARWTQMMAARRAPFSNTTVADLIAS